MSGLQTALVGALICSLTSYIKLDFSRDVVNDPVCKVLGVCGLQVHVVEVL